MKTTRLIGFGPDLHLVRPDLDADQVSILNANWARWHRVRLLTASMAGLVTFTAVLAVTVPSLCWFAVLPPIAWAGGASVGALAGALVRSEVLRGWAWGGGHGLALPLTPADRLRMAKLARHLNPDVLHAAMWRLCAARADAAGTVRALQHPDAQDADVHDLLREDLERAAQEAHDLSTRLTGAARQSPRTSFAYLA